MGSLHWLILFPYYFFTAVSLYLLLTLVCRVVRAGASANPLAMTAALSAVVLTALPLLAGMTRLAQYSWQGLVALLAINFVLATVDAVLAGSLKLPLDSELEDI